MKCVIRDIRNHPKRNRHETDIDLDHLLYLYKIQKGRCAVSNIKMTWGFNEEENIHTRQPLNISVDRVDNSKGYTKDNVVLICSSINAFKNSYDISLVREIAEEIVKHKDRLDKIMKKVKNDIEHNSIAS